MIDIVARLGNETLRVEPGDIINFDLDGSEESAGRIEYTGETAVLHIGQDITIAGGKQVYVIAD